MADGIFLIGDDGALVELIDTPYESESVLQELLAQYPEVLAGNQIDAEQPRRWLLVGREIAVPAEEDGAGRWAVDHLFLDQERRKSPGGRATGEWDENRFMEALAKKDPEAVEPARELLEWGRRRMGRIWWGKGAVSGSFIPMLDRHGQNYSLISVWTNGVLQVQFGYMVDRPPFDDAEIRSELRHRLASIPGVSFAENTQKFPSVPLSVFRGPRMAELIEVLEWAVDLVEKWSPG
jgi:hypothetical protein